MTPHAESYATKDSGYFRNVRHEVLPHISPRDRCILEVGCGEGATLRFLKEQCNARWVGGIEIHAPAADVARSHLDWISTEDIEASNVAKPNVQVDILLLLDVLEHLRDPWTTLSRLSRDFVRPGGTVVVSLPNIRSLRIVARLLILGDWRYADTGILDRTHLRFFTRKTGVELLRQANLHDVHAVPLVPKRLRWASSILRALRIDELVASQIVFRARRGN
jgi:2-polyprenyl-3-methyl-5-hydroxy-6-metoxy-1,4-benzoquinol methylase